MPFTHSNRMYLIHKRGGDSNGLVRTLKHAMLDYLIEGCVFMRPQMPHGYSGLVSAEESVLLLGKSEIPAGSLLIGFGFGGLIAAKLQESRRTDLQVIAINSPNSEGRMVLQEKTENRVALYSSSDSELSGRTADWPNLADAYDLPWLSEDIATDMSRLAPLVAAFVNGTDPGSHIWLKKIHF